MVFLVVFALLVWMTYAIFSKAFVRYATVTLRASRTGLQLPVNADVKIRGVIVGMVRGRTVTRRGVDLALGIYPDKASVIPENVTARIVPKTLFGEKYVALQVPAQPRGSIHAGDVIS
ncbi:MAG TPA: MlaD family protein, partial [Nocardioidaceae bacterium]|nr:MlaD family protein [Nocardioidaceae bacterium]